MNKKIIKKATKTFFIIGIFLLAINTIGLITPLENKGIYQQKSGFKNDISLSEKEALEKINQLNKENTKNYVTQVNKIFNQRILHYWHGKNDKKYHIILPFYENYILYFLTHTIYRQNALHYEFCDYNKTLERGVGFCSQATTALADFLNKQKIHTNVIAWPLRTITKVEVEPNTWWVIDPDYGVTIPHSINDINKNPNLIQPFFNEAGYSDKTINRLIDVYSYQDKKVFKYDGPGYANYNSIRKKVEDWSYVFIWIIPLFLILPFAITKYKEKYAKTTK